MFNGRRRHIIESPNSSQLSAQLTRVNRPIVTRANHALKPRGITIFSFF